ncbi:DUF2784 family protein [Chitinivibrio alkaliphilus]|uniref:DUF2784 domain-containing protein n=1 Tax=Chitinivibrio alkaliphilus ACht1 TaxID=1313304 RepID=U7D9T9_9BACT|nr:DUF2784 family protein [Chitinivibrio alkaliphilus]ERP39169.1 hypothetical protein CALK_0339 [Chitinivibrio alkaliphilus ACht1]
MAELLNLFFWYFHSAIILCTLLGWIDRRTRWIHRIVILLTWLSWFGGGIRYGFGYCFLTDWHWNIRRELGYAIPTDSFIHFLLMRVTGIHMHRYFVDGIAVLALVVVTGIAVYQVLHGERSSPP